jgi:hypothetical protein
MSAALMRLWRAPMLFALLTTIGLVSALLGDGIWDDLSTLALGMPVAACGWYGLRRKTGLRSRREWS